MLVGVELALDVFLFLLFLLLPLVGRGACGRMVAGVGGVGLVLELLGRAAVVGDVGGGGNGSRERLIVLRVVHVLFGRCRQIDWKKDSAAKK